MSLRSTGVSRALITVAVAGLWTYSPAASASGPPAAVRTTPLSEHEPEFGPPPFRYERIVGEPVPGWTPDDLFRTVPGSLSWIPIGPRPILNEVWSGNDDASGRVVSIAIHPTDPQTVYIASASGGVWKTTDGGALWVPLTDELPILNHGAVALDPTDPEIVYAGTGEYTTGSQGDGLFRSTDGGLTWDRIALRSEVGQRCSRIVVDPLNPQRIHVTGNLGYARTDDGGDTWSRPISGACSDVAINPLDPDIVYVGRHGDGVYRSTDGGLTFTRLTGGLPNDDVHRILIAVAASNPDVVYTAIINGSSGLRGLYKTTDGGDTWVRLNNTPDFPRPQGWYDACIAVDPTDENTIFAGGVFPTYAEAGIIRSTDGGNSWIDVTIGQLGGQVHPDMHALAFGPDGTVWVGCDGGVWKTTDQGLSWINTNATLTVTQNYNIALHPTDPAQVMGGTQDNGTIGREEDILPWPQIIGGDGGFLAYDFANPTRIYTTYVALTVFRFDNRGFRDITGPWGNDPRNFIAPLVMDPNDSRVLLGGTNRVWRTDDATQWTPVWVPISDSDVSGGGTLNAIAVSVGDSNLIYTGSSRGNVFVTFDGSVWHDRSAGLPGTSISDIVIDPDDPATAYVSFHRTTGTRVAVTHDFGLTWESATGSLPAGVAARALAVDWAFQPPHLYVGSGAGVYHSPDGGQTWIKDGVDLPNVNIGDLQIDPINRTITAGTYGRGSWRAELPPPLSGDFDGDGDVDIADFAFFTSCFTGSGVPCSGECCDADLDGDGDADIADFAIFASQFTGSQ